MSAPPPAPSFSSFPDLNFLNPPPPPKPESSSTRDKERDREGDRPSKRSRRSPVDEDRSFGRSRRETEDERRERKDRERRRDRDRDDKDRYSSSRRKDRDDRDRPSSSSGPTPPVPAPSEPQSASSTLFYKDTKGDEGNKTYGSLHAPSVAKFHRSGAGNVIGLPQGVKITRESNRAGGKTLEVEWSRPRGGGYSSPRYTDVSSRPLVTSTTRVRLLPTATPTETTFLPLFIALPKSKPKPASKTIESNDQAYRSIHPDSDSDGSDSDDEPANEGAALEGGGVFGHLAPPADADDDAPPSTEDEGETDESLVRSKNVYFSKRVKADPTDVDAWLAWADFSSTAGFASASSDMTSIPSSKNPIPSSSGPTVHSKAAIVLPHLLHALSLAPTLDRSARFMLALLDASAEVEPPAKTSDRWDQVLSGVLGSEIEVWRAWGGWRMERGDGGNEGVGEAGWVVEGLNRLRKSWSGEGERTWKREGIEGIEVYLLLRGCLGLREAGYPERALAILQAQIELIFFAPAHLANRPRAEQLASLEEFWDAECPRFGEAGAKGWASFDPAAPAPPPSPPPPPSTAPPPAPPTSDDPFTLWLAAETSACSTSSLPTRTTDPPLPIPSSPSLTNEEDPYHLILFPDIASFLFPLQSPNIKPHLLYALFTFLDLPFTPPESSTSSPFYADPYLQARDYTISGGGGGGAGFWPDHLRGIVPGRRMIGEDGFELEVERGVVGRAQTCPVRSWPVGVEGMFGGGKGKNKAGSGWGVMEGLKTRGGGGMKEFVSGVLEQVRTKIYPSDLLFALYAFSFEAVWNVKGAVKLAKTILADHRDSLALWDGYARLERQRGKLDDARKVYVTALSLSSDEVKSMSAEGRGQAWVLWKGWVEMEWEAGEWTRVARVLEAAAAGKQGLDGLDRFLKPVDPTSPGLTPVQILPTRQFYSQTIALSLSPTSPRSLTQNTTHLLHLSALFEYLTTAFPNPNLSAASDVYERFLAATAPPLPPLSSGTDTATRAPYAEPILTPLEREEAWLSYTSLLYHHSTSPTPTPYRPAQVRDVFERAVAEFPSNTRIGAMWVETETRMGVQMRVRRVLEDKVLAPGGKVGDEGEVGPGGWLFAVWLELGMVKGRHNEWAVRRLLERALDRPSTKSSISLWRVAIEHELLLGQAGRAKGLLYRAIKACPWSKALYLLPFGPLRNSFTAKELEEVADLMADRKIRLRVPIEPFLEDYAGDDASDEDEEMGEDERRLVREQIERKALMPY